MDDALRYAVTQLSMDEEVIDLLMKLGIRSATLVQVTQEHMGFLKFAEIEANQRDASNPHSNRDLADRVSRCSSDLELLGQTVVNGRKVIDAITAIDYTYGGFRDRSASAKQHTQPSFLRAAPTRQDIEAKKARTKGAEVKILSFNQKQGYNNIANRLRDKEADTKRETTEKLLAILDKVGGNGTLREDLVSLYGAEAKEILADIRGKASPGTSEGHIGRWRAMEIWANNQIPPLQVYPPDEALLGRYLLHRKREGCGSTVPDSVRATVTWMCKLFRMKRPNCDSADIIAIRDKVVETRTKEKKQAIPVHMELMKAMEEQVDDFGGDGRTDLEVKVVTATTWWLLCLILGSLRYDDGLHVKTPRASGSRSSYDGSQLADEDYEDESWS